MSARSPGRWLVAAASAVVVTAVAAGMLSIGTPGEQQQARMDRKREQDLQRIVQAIEARAENSKPLPTDLQSLAGEPGRRLAISDPANDTAYAYAITGPDSYRVCAVFATDTASKRRMVWIDEAWLHGPGRHCFDRKLKRSKS